MKDKPNPISRIFHEDWVDSRYDMLQGKELSDANNSIDHEIYENNEWHKVNPSDLMLGNYAERCMSRSEARDYKFEQQQLYRKRKL